MPPAQSRIAYALLMFTALFWGGNAVAGKLAVGHIPPMTLTAARCTLSFLIVLGVGWPNLRRQWPELKSGMKMLFPLGATGFALFNITLYSALQYTTAINVAIEQAAMPLVIFVANFLLFGMRAGPIRILGFLLSVAGVAITASAGDLSRLAGLQINRGDAIMLVAIMAYGGYTVALRYKPALDWQTVMIGMVFAGMVTSWPFAVWEYLSGAAYWPDLTGLGVVAYTAFIPSLVAQVFYIRGVELIGSNRAGLFINLVPVFATVLAIVILGERFHAYHALAMILVIGGIALSERSADKTQKSGR